MTNRILVRIQANTHTLEISTYTPRMKSSQHFLICYTEFDRLQRDGQIISNDIYSFVVIRLNEKHDRIEFDFTWLSGRCNGRVEGFTQAVNLRWSKFQTFLQDCRLPDGPRMFKAISLGELRGRPRLTFVGKRENLKAAISNPHVRHKLGKALMENFCWPFADEIRLFDDSLPYSFFFREFQDGQALMCGGLILHDQEDIRKAHYSIHT